MSKQLTFFKQMDSIWRILKKIFLGFSLWLHLFSEGKFKNMDLV